MTLYKHKHMFRLFFPVPCMYDAFSFEFATAIGERIKDVYFYSTLAEC